jgi:DNA-directed RNA polymerase sigma subunit (sigma70/sigma32)
MTTASSRERVARNFVRRYGADRFARLLQALSLGESGQAIADEFKVSRERVRQWKNTFGQVLTLYQVHSEVQQVLDEQDFPEIEL